MKNKPSVKVIPIVQDKKKDPEAAQKPSQRGPWALGKYFWGPQGNSGGATQALIPKNPPRTHLELEGPQGNLIGATHRIYWFLLFLFCLTFPAFSYLFTYF